MNRTSLWPLPLENLSGKFIVSNFSLNKGPKSYLPFPCLSYGLWSDAPLNASFYSKGCFCEQTAPSLFGSRSDPISKQKHPAHLLALEQEKLGLMLEFLTA